MSQQQPFLETIFNDDEQQHDEFLLFASQFDHGIFSLEDGLMTATSLPIPVSPQQQQLLDEEEQGNSNSADDSDDADELLETLQWLNRGESIATINLLPAQKFDADDPAVYLGVISAFAGEAAAGQSILSKKNP